MKISIKINTNEGSENQRPIYIHISHKNKRKKFVLVKCPEKFWDGNNFVKAHPNYFSLQPFLASLRAKFYEYEMLTDVYQVKAKILDYQKEYFSIENKETIYLDEFAKEYINGLQNEGNKTVYNTFLRKIEKHKRNVRLNEVDYIFVQNFVRFLKSEGLKKNSISNYLRSFRAIYNEYVRKYRVEDNKPFQNAFSGLTQKYTVKKYLEYSEIEKLENANFDTSGKQKARDFFLLMFYFGGLNFKDLFFLNKRQIHNGRIYLKRGKTDSYEFDLKIFPKAKKILDKYNFPLGDNHKSFLTVKRNIYRSLILIQKDLNIYVSPKDEKLGLNVARHTFSTLGVQQGVNREIKALLMGHEIGDIQAFYETYSADMRDVEHAKIIRDSTD